MKTIAFIFARGGSKGIPRKNLQEIGGTPLIGHSINHALSNENISEIFVSTDDAEIAAYCNSRSIKVINRPVELASDDSPEWLSWQHAILSATELLGPFERFISLPATAPLRSQENINESLLALTKDVDVVVTGTPARRHPSFNLVVLNSNSHVELFSPPSEALFRRQDVNEAYDMTTVAYVSRPHFVLDHNSIWDGDVALVKVSEFNAIDIDTPQDLEIARFLYSKNETELGNE